MTHAQAEALKECRCDGSGKVEWEDPPERAASIGGGVIVKPMGALGSSLCPCRKALVPREGQARWWTTEPVYSATVAVPIFNESISISASVEVPVDEQNYPVVRRGNRWYPTLIEIEAPASIMLHPDTARELGQRLIAAAEAADLADLPDTDTCGHWWPCDCGAKKGA